MARALLTISFAFSLTLLYGQYVMNLGLTASPLRTVSHKIGYTEVELTYSSPSVKGRTIWGGLEPYDEVWRAGANYATVISFSEDVDITGVSVPAGQYSFFVIPREADDWTLILNKVDKQWGAFKYNSDDDVIRIDAGPVEINHQEQLRYDIESSDNKGGRIILRWERIEIGFDFKTSLKASLKSQLNRNLKTATAEMKWMNYLQAAEILLNENEALSTAMEWINKAEEYSTIDMEWSPQFAPKNYVFGHLYWIKAQIFARHGDYSQAFSSASKMKNLKGQRFYLKNAKKANIDSVITSWKVK